MSLTLPAAYEAALKRPFKENWLIKLFYDSDPDSNPNNCLKLSFDDTEADSQEYHGSILNEPSIRESIDLRKGIAGTDNIRLEVANFKYKGDDLSAELLGGPNKYINKDVRIYSQLNDESTLSNCLLIYEGRLLIPIHTATKVFLTIIQKRPWSLVDIPQVLSTMARIHHPIVYGSYTPNASTRTSKAFCPNVNLYPCPVVAIIGQDILALQPQALDGSGGQEGRLHIYEKNADVFAPLTDSGDNYEDATHTKPSEPGDFSKQVKQLYRGFKLKPIAVHEDNEWTDAERAFNNRDDDNYNTYTIATENRSSVGTTTKTIYLEVPQLIGKLMGTNILQLQIRYRLTRTSSGGTPTGTVKLINRTYGRSDEIASLSSDGNTGDLLSSAINMTTNYNSNDYQMPEYIAIELEIDYTGGTGTLTGLARIYDVHIIVKGYLDFTNDREASQNILDGLDKVFCGADGLAKTYNGGSGAATKIHEIHRDLLARYAGFDEADGNLLGWSSLDTDRASWLARLWILDPPWNLNAILRKLAFEGGFIFRIRPGGGRYIHILDSYGSGDLAHTLTKNDVRNLEIQCSKISSLITKRNIRYERHPAEKKYLSSITSTNATARADWNIGAKENIIDRPLDYYVAPTPATDPTAGNPNDDFASYYNAINGDIKLMGKSDIVNGIMFDLEAGDVIAFDHTNMIVDPYGYSWQNRAFMITKMIRKVGYRACELQQVGTVT